MHQPSLISYKQKDYNFKARLVVCGTPAHIPSDAKSITYAGAADPTNIITVDAAYRADAIQRNVLLQLRSVSVAIYPLHICRISWQERTSRVTKSLWNCLENFHTPSLAPGSTSWAAVRRKIWQDAGRNRWHRKHKDHPFHPSSALATDRVKCIQLVVLMVVNFAGKPMFISFDNVFMFRLSESEEWIVRK